jgi:ERO1-like protein beta
MLTRFQRHSLPGCYYRDSDFCYLDDNTEGDHYDLRLIPERYTGYSGHDAHRVWRSIYEENCFGLTELNLLSAKAPSLMSLPDTMTEVLHEDGEESNAQCLEKRVYYKVISGLHASISTHICAEWLNQSTGEWVRTQRLRGLFIDHSCFVIEPRVAHFSFLFSYFIIATQSELLHRPSRIAP